jgi:hypothetical protein
MHIRKLLYLIIPLILTPGVVTAHGGGVTYKYGSGGYFGKHSRALRNYYRPSYNNFTGPVTSFNRAYGPVTSFGLRNYYGYRNSEHYYRRIIIPGHNFRKGKSPVKSRVYRAVLHK